MIYNSLNYRIPIGDTDAMGIVYYANYLRYFEIGRNAFIRDTFRSYRDIEAAGVSMPVASVEVKYLKPGRFEDLLEIRTFIKELPCVKLYVYTEIYNQDNELVCTGKTKLAIIDKERQRPQKAPQDMVNALKGHLYPSCTAS